MSVRLMGRVGGCQVYWEITVARGKTGLFSSSKGPGIDSGFGFKHSFLTLSGEKVTC